MNAHEASMIDEPMRALIEPFSIPAERCADMLNQLNDADIRICAFPRRILPRCAGHEPAAPRGLRLRLGIWTG